MTTVPSNKSPRRMTEALPPRNPALHDDRMLLSFDIDCGPLAKGHRFVARGVSDRARCSIPRLSIRSRRVLAAPSISNMNSFPGFHHRRSSNASFST